MAAEQSTDGGGRTTRAWRGFLDALLPWLRKLLSPDVGVGVLLLVIIFGFFGVDWYKRWGVGHLRWLGADVRYGPKGGYFVTLPPGSDVTEFLKRGTRDLNHISRYFHTSLELDGTTVSDSDLLLLEPVQGSVGLYLSLRNTAITDKGLQHLQGLPNVAGVDVTDSKVTKETIREFLRSRGLEVPEPSPAAAPAPRPVSSGEPSPPPEKAAHVTGTRARKRDLPHSSSANAW